MKKIINGKMYNTETAQIVGTWNNKFGYRDFRCCEETLYVKKTGEFFLHGEGGPLTCYATQMGDSKGWGEQIIPYTEDDAKEWAENNLSAEEYVALFGTVEE